MSETPSHYTHQIQNCCSLPAPLKILQGPMRKGPNTNHGGAFITRMSHQRIVALDALELFPSLYSSITLSKSSTASM